MNSLGFRRSPAPRHRSAARLGGDGAAQTARSGRACPSDRSLAARAPRGRSARRPRLARFNQRCRLVAGPPRPPASTSPLSRSVAWHPIGIPPATSARGPTQMGLAEAHPGDLPFPWASVAIARICAGRGRVLPPRMMARHTSGRTWLGARGETGYLKSSGLRAEPARAVHDAEWGPIPSMPPQSIGGQVCLRATTASPPLQRGFQ